MKKNRKVFRNILFVAAGVLCLLCVSALWTLNASFASEGAASACARETYCGIYNTETEEVLFVGGCAQWYAGGCGCYGKFVNEYGQLVGEPTFYFTDFCDMW